MLAVGDAAGTARVFDAATRAVRAELRGHNPGNAPPGEFTARKFALPGLALSRDGRRLLFTQIDREGGDLMLVDKFR